MPPNRKIKKNKRCPTRLAVIRAYPSAYQSFPKIVAVIFSKKKKKMLRSLSSLTTMEGKEYTMSAVIKYAFKRLIAKMEGE
jgi:hypothetical protein